MAASASAESVAAAAPPATTAAGDVDGALLARELLVVLASVAALRVGALLDDVGETAAPVGRLFYDALIDGHPRAVARTLVRADRRVGEPVRHQADQERDPPRSS